MMLLHQTGRTNSQGNMDMAKGMETPSSVLDSFWASDNNLPAASFPPSSYLHGKDTAYDMFSDSQNAAGLADWPRDLPSFSDQVNRAAVPDLFSALATDPFYCPPPALATDISAPSWALDGSVGDSTPEAADGAFFASLALGAQRKRKTSAVEEEDAALSALASPSTAMPAERTKQKASTAARAQPKRGSSAKALSVSSASSSSSHDDSLASSPMPRGLSGHGGNHKITLRTASRKPKPATIKTEGDGGGHRQASGTQQQSPVGLSPLSPDGGYSNGNGNGSGNGSGNGNSSSNSNSNSNSDNLTSEERRARQNHNVVEKQYRNRLNSQFEKLLAILPANERDGPAGGSPSSRSGGNGNGNSNSSGSRGGGGGGGGGGAAVVYDDRRMSKAEVLELARRRIHALEQERLQLRAERQKLLESATVMQQQQQQQQQQELAMGTAP